MIGGMRRLLAWLVCVPIIAAGTQFAHAVAYGVVEPDGSARAELLHQSGHGYLSALSLLLGIGWGVVVLGFAMLALDAARGGRAARPSALPFAVLGPIVFAFQEHIERLLHDGTFPVSAALEPTFLVGIALQVPFALAALLVARMVLRAADRLGHIFLAPSRSRFAAPGQPALPRPAAIDAFRPLHLRASLGVVRGPPSLPRT